MTLESFIEVANLMTKDNQFTIKQWENIISCAFATDRNFNSTVEHFYMDLLRFDYEDCKDLLVDIQTGNGDAFDRFITDIHYYFANN